MATEHRRWKVQNCGRGMDSFQCIYVSVKPFSMILCLYIIIKFQMEPKKDQIMCFNVWTLTVDICGKTPKISNKIKIKANTTNSPTYVFQTVLRSGGISSGNRPYQSILYAYAYLYYLGLGLGSVGEYDETGSDLNPERGREACYMVVWGG